MLFKFKSQAASDLIMLEADARKLLKIMVGDDPVRGIVLSADLSRVITALELAMQIDEANRKKTNDQDPTLTPVEEEETVPLNTVSLSQRAAPMLKLLKRCQSEASDVVWGV